ncbi:zinc finger MYM-type protein 1-like, partial [Aphis craccivora]
MHRHFVKCERSLSAMINNTNCLRTFMSQNRFTKYVSIIYIELDLSNDLFNEHILHKFSISPSTIIINRYINVKFIN